jgi:hypothetical protein
MAKMGKGKPEKDRDPKTGRTTRTKVLPLRMTRDEEDAFRECAGEKGLGIGPWLRALGMREVERAEDGGATVERTTRTALLPIRMTEEELEGFLERASEEGLGVGPWLRTLGMREVQRRRATKER